MVNFQKMAKRGRAHNGPKIFQGKPLITTIFYQIRYLAIFIKNFDFLQGTYFVKFNLFYTFFYSSPFKISWPFWAGAALGQF